MWSDWDRSPAQRCGVSAVFLQSMGGQRPGMPGMAAAKLEK
jgi:hypothetical protein